MNSIGQCLQALESQPVIAAIRDQEGLNRAVKSPAAVVFLLDGALSNLRERVERVAASGKLIFVHLEMIAGLSKDLAALEYVAGTVRPDGIISTKPGLIQPARNLGLLTIQRLFILDSQSLQTGIKMIQGNHPDLVEVMPGVIPKAVTALKAHCSTPVIAGGMVERKEEIIELLKAGVTGVSTSRIELWEV
jgi:glycerol uptake operon antiterminator